MIVIPFQNRTASSRTGRPVPERDKVPNWDRTYIYMCVCVCVCVCVCMCTSSGLPVPISYQPAGMGYAASSEDKRSDFVKFEQ